MIGYYDNRGPGASYNEAPAEDPIKLAVYKRHVANATVPKSGIPYTVTGIEKYRHKSVQDDFKYNQAPVYPRWTAGAGLKSEVLRYQKIPKVGNATKTLDEAYPIPDEKYATDPEVYVRKFNELRHLK